MIWLFLRSVWRRIASFIRNTMFMVLLMTLLASCHTSRHVVSNVDGSSDSYAVRQQEAYVHKLDSLISHLSITADSITILLYDNAGTYTSLRGSAFAHTYDTALAVSQVLAADSLQGSDPAHPPTKTSSIRSHITIHSPAINKEERHGSNTTLQTNMADSTRSHADTSSHIDDSKEAIGVAEPPKLTWVFIALGIGIPLLIILAFFGYLWLRKRGII